MTAVNNIFLVAGDPLKRYIKTVDFRLAGKRLHPTSNQPVDFIIAGDPAHGIVYDEMVIELYSDKEIAYFMQVNRYLIRAGYIKEYDAAPEAVDVSNLLTDEDVEAIATIRNIPALEARLDELSSVVTLQRVLNAAAHVGRPQKVLNVIQSKIDQGGK